VSVWRFFYVHDAASNSQEAKGSTLPAISPAP
jgi:hypothetical protein